MHGTGSRNKLTPSHARHYPGPGLLDQLGRAICTVHCLPRKELHEAWEMAHRVVGRFAGGRVVDLCAGYGLLGQVLLLLDDTFTEAVAVDVRPSPNHRVVHEALVAAFPRLAGRVRFVASPLQAFAIDACDLVVSAHACGALTDDVIDRAVAASARVAVLPCCHRTRFRADLTDVDDPALAVDRERVTQLRARGYRVWTPAIPADVSPKNRLLLGVPADANSNDAYDVTPWS